MSAAGCGVSAVEELVPGTIFWLKGRFYILYPVSKAQVAGLSCCCLRAYCISYFCPTLLYCRVHSGSKCHPNYCEVLE
jgi:hypothetical protein